MPPLALSYSFFSPLSFFLLPISPAGSRLRLCHGSLPPTIRTARAAALLPPLSGRHSPISFLRCRHSFLRRHRRYSLLPLPPLLQRRRSPSLLLQRPSCRASALLALLHSPSGKLWEWPAALRDCDAALSARPSYGKARLRRAACNDRLGRWEASVLGYEVRRRGRRRSARPRAKTAWQRHAFSGKCEACGYPSGPPYPAGGGYGENLYPATGMGRVTGVTKRGGYGYGDAKPVPEPGGCHP